MAEILLVRGSVLEQPVEAIVNAANGGMRGGGGLDGAIHRAAGPELLEELRQKAPSGAPTGGVVVTQGYRTGFKAILHTPGPVWKGGSSGEPASLAACYRNALDEVKALGLASIALPSISTGLYGYPIDQAAPLVVKTVYEWVEAQAESPLQRIVFAMYGGVEFEAFEKALAAHAVE